MTTTLAGEKRMKLLSDPRLFNYLLIILFALCSVRWAFARSWPDTLYWGFGCALNAVVTWGYHR